MVLRKPVFSDHLHKFRIYSDGNPDPAGYFIWHEGMQCVVTRKYMESSSLLYSRVCTEAKIIRLTSFGHPSAFTHIYAGIAPSEAELKELDRQSLLYMFRHIATSGKTSKERVNAAIRLAELHGVLLT